MAEHTKSVWRRPGFWTAIVGIGVIQFFTVNTSPLRHRPNRLPASVDDSATAGPAKPDVRLIVMSWDVQTLSRSGDYDRAAMVLGDADVVVLENLDLQSQGKGFMSVIVNLIESKTKQKFCRAWTQGPDGARLPYGYLWRESLVGYMEPSGEMHDDCGPIPLTIHQEDHSQAGVHATFYVKSPRKLFELAAVAWDKKPKNNSEILEAFHGVGERQWPVLVAGDFKLNSTDGAFKDIEARGFRTALDASKRRGRPSFENLWYRNAALVSSGTIDLYERFGDVRRQDIANAFSDRFPIAVEFRPFDDPKEELTLLAKNKPAPPPPSVPGPMPASIASSKKKPKAHKGKKKKAAKVKESLESEAAEADKAAGGR